MTLPPELKEGGWPPPTEAPWAKDQLLLGPPEPEDRRAVDGLRQRKVDGHKLPPPEKTRHYGSDKTKERKDITSKKHNILITCLTRLVQKCKYTTGVSANNQVLNTSITPKGEILVWHYYFILV